MTAYIAGYARTPFVKFTGQFARIPATQLGAHAAKAALDRAGVTPDQVDLLIAGQVLQGGAGQNPARQTAIGAGIPMGVPSFTVNAVCLSGAEAVTQAVRYLKSGEADVVVAVGQESMSLAPHVSSLRAGTKFGAATFVDTVEHDGLTDAFERISMGLLTEQGNEKLGIGREEQDAFAAASHQRAAASAEFLAEEIAPYTISSRGKDTIVDSDDGVRAETTAESLAALRPAFKQGGSVTAGNASQITDGAAAVVLVSERALEKLGLQALAVIEATSLVAGPDVSLQAQPSNAIQRALEGVEGTTAADLKRVEINEAFASVAIESAKQLGISDDIINVHGGAIALGHPIGASGARIVGTLARQLKELGAGSLGAVGICGGGGQGTGLILRAV